MSGKIEPTLVVAAVIQCPSQERAEVLIVRRGPEQSGAGFWEFPGGKVEAGESPEEALKREIDEELGMTIQVGSLVGEMDFAYPAKVIRLRVYWAECQTRELSLVEHDAFLWCRPEQIKLEELSPADRPFVALLGQGRR